MIVLPAVRQTLWGPLAVANFVLGGMGAGAYVVAALLSGFAPTPLLEFTRPSSLLLVVAGFLCVAAEAGRPFRGPNVLRMIRSSWMSRELWAGGAFILLVLADLFRPAPWLRPLALLAAVVFILSQGLILSRARGIAAWNLPLVPVLFLTSGLLTGAGLLGLIVSEAPGLAYATSGLLGLNALAWVGYLGWPGDRAFRETTRGLRGWSAHAGILGLGHLVPLVVLGVQRAPGLFLAGLFILLGGVFLKASLILRAGQFRPIGVDAGRRTNGPAPMPFGVPGERRESR